MNIGTPKKVVTKDDHQATADINRNFSNIWMILSELKEKIEKKDLGIFEEKDGNIIIRINGINKKLKVENENE